MRKRRRQSGLSCALAWGVMLFAILPPGVSHSHSMCPEAAAHDHGDERAHEHDPADGPHCGGFAESASHHVRDIESGANSADTGLVPGEHWHQHFAILGFRVLFTGDAPQSEPNGKSDGKAVVFAMPRKAPTAAASTSLLFMKTGATHSPALAFLSPCADGCASSQRVLQSQPLCDSARLERTGVRLM